MNKDRKGVTNRFLFFLFKILKRTEEFLSGRNLKKVPGVLAFYYRVAVPFGDFLYEKARVKKTVLADIQGNKMYLDTNDNSMVPKLLMDRSIEEYETELFKKAVKEGMVVVDVGANIGYYTLIAARLVGKNGFVYAFEPEPSSYNLLYKNIKENSYTNIVSVRKAISNKEERTKFWFNKFASPCSSLSEANLSEKSRNRFSKKDEFIEIDAITLDNFFEKVVKSKKIDVIKIDVQGAEGLVLEGAEEILKSNNSLKIFTEIWPDGLKSLGTDPYELLKKMEGYGFEIRLINERRQALEHIEITDLIKRAKTGDEFNLLLER